MKKKLIWLLVPILLVAISAIATVAYLATTDSERNSVTVGDASIELVEFERADVNGNKTDAIVPFDGDDKVLLPTTLKGDLTYANPDYTTTTPADYVAWNKDENGDEIKVGGKTGYKTPIWNPDNITYELDKMVFVRNTGNTNVYVRICFAFEAGNYVYKSHFDRMVHLNKNETDWTWEWYNNGKVVEMNGTRYYIVWATYKHVLPGGEYTRISLSQIALDTSAINDHVNAFYGNYEVKAFAQGIQADGFEGIGGLVDGAPAPSKDAPAALNKGFGAELPFRNVKKVEFTDLKTALHYLNADTNGLMLKGESDNKPSSIVNSVTFGLTKDHPDVVKNRKGVLVANKVNEADFTAYAYYVLNEESKYNIYVLADNWKIYAPSSSSGLFYQMSGLTVVDTSNIDFSYAMSMQAMFKGCISLQKLDTSDWDVSKVTNMQYMFQSCKMLNNIDVSGWNTANVTIMQYMFYKCEKITSLDVSNWDVSNLTSASYMFQSCGALTYLDVSKWKVDKVTAAEHMFHGCSSLQKLDVSDWKLNKVTSFISMFEGCSSLTALDVSKWTIDIATDTKAMFSGCKKLKELNVSNFDVSEVTTMQTMFSGCSSLKSLDLSTFKVDKVTTMKSMFEGCGELVSLNLSNWNVGEVTDMSAMFANCAALPSSSISNISGWNVANVATMENLFKGCSSFIEIDLSGWTTRSLTNTRYMFSACTNLKTIYVGGSDKWIMSGVTLSDFMFSDCGNLKGGKGTTISGKPVDQTYACVDTADTPGYLTLK